MKTDFKFKIGQKVSQIGGGHDLLVIARRMTEGPNGRDNEYLCRVLFVIIIDHGRPAEPKCFWFHEIELEAKSEEE